MSDGIRIDYAELMGTALRSVVARVLQRASEEGLPGDHYFYLTFRTDGEGVEIPAVLQQRYPEEITIVLQNQFWDLYADDHRFAVSLRFDGVLHRLVVPFAALAAFVDPAAEFALRFTHGQEGAAAAPDPTAEPAASERSPTEGTSEAEPGTATVVQLDNFRKR